MAHEIETHGNAAAFVTAKTHAWHKLGTVLPDAFTAEDAMREAYLGGWNVRKSPLTTVDVTDSGVTTVEVPDKYAMLRTSPFTGQAEALGVVGNQYEPIQNEEHAQFLNDIVDESGAHFETAGSLRGGREVFLTMRVPEYMKVGGIDPVDLYLVALNAHDGTQSFRLLITPVRVVCANTQAAALRNNLSSVSIRHTRNAKSSLEEARRALDLSFAYADEFSVLANEMVESTLTDAKFSKLITKFFPDPKSLSERQQRTRQDEIDALEALWASSPTLSEIKGTAWAGYQTVTEYLDHYRPMRGVGDGDEDVMRAERAIKPETARIKESAFATFAMAM